MAGSVNKVILIGNLGQDPEVRQTQDGRPIVNLRVATTESWRDKNSGERREKTEWHRVVIFSEGLCRVAENYLKKGSKVWAYVKKGLGAYKMTEGKITKVHDKGVWYEWKASEGKHVAKISFAKVIAKL